MKRGLGESKDSLDHKQKHGATRMTDPKKPEPSITSLHAEYKQNYAPRVTALYGMPRAQMELQLENIFGEFERSPFYQTMLAKLGENLTKSTFMTIKGNECDKARDHAMVEGIEADLARAFGETNFAKLQDLRKMAEKSPSDAKRELKKLLLDDFARSEQYLALVKTDPEHTQPAVQTFYGVAKSFVTGESDTILIPYISAARTIRHNEPVTIAQKDLEQLVKSPEEQIVAYRAKVEAIEQSFATAVEALGSKGAQGYHENPSDRKAPFDEEIRSFLDRAEMREFYGADAAIARDFAFAKIRGWANVAGIQITETDLKAYALYLDAPAKTDAPEMPAAAPDSDPLDLNTPPAPETPADQPPAPRTSDAVAHESSSTETQTPEAPVAQAGSATVPPAQEPPYQSKVDKYVKRGALAILGAGALAGAVLFGYVLPHNELNNSVQSKYERSTVHHAKVHTECPFDAEKSVPPTAEDLKFGGNLEDQVLGHLFAGKFAESQKKFDQLVINDADYQRLAIQTLGWKGGKFDDSKFNKTEQDVLDIIQGAYDVFDDDVAEAKTGDDLFSAHQAFMNALQARKARNEIDEATFLALRRLALARMIEQTLKKGD